MWLKYSLTFIMRNSENTKEAEEILDRISEELARQGKMQAELVSYLDLPKGAYSSWKAGKSRNFCEHLGEIAQFLGVSVEFLVTGRNAEKNMVNPREEELILLYRGLNVEKQDALWHMAKLLSE